MKTLSLLFVIFSFFNVSAVHAEQLDLFPKDDSALMCRGEVYVTSKSLEVDGFSDGCYSSDVLNGDVCFTGDAQWAAWALNQSILWGDEEWVENAKVENKDKVVMDWVDGPNDQREETSISRCQ